MGVVKASVEATLIPTATCELQVFKTNSVVTLIVFDILAPAYVEAGARGVVQVGVESLPLLVNT